MNGNSQVSIRSQGKQRKSIFRLTRSHSKNRQDRDEKNKYFGSLSSLKSNRSSDQLTTVELSWEQGKSKEGFPIHFLKVFCEGVRTGDHFKTLKISRSFTVEQCIKSLVETYYSKYGSPDDFNLHEIIGRILSIPSINDGATTVWSFVEQNNRVLGLSENMLSLFETTSPGTGLCRRIELRPKKLLPMVCSTPTTRRQTHTNKKTVNNNNISSTPNLIRTSTPTGLTKLFKDSRRVNQIPGINIPNGPHLLLIRGNQAKNDQIVYDLTKLINNNSNKTYLTIGRGKNIDIQLYPTPNELVAPTDSDEIIAKLVGYDVPLNSCSQSDINGIIYLEPSNENNELINSIDIYINNELIKNLSINTFNKQQLCPGDLIYFGSQQRGYIFLFKDPRWIPDHRLELPFLNKLSKSIDNMNYSKNNTNSDHIDYDNYDTINEKKLNSTLRKADLNLETTNCLPKYDEFEYIWDNLLIEIKPITPSINRNYELITSFHSVWDENDQIRKDSCCTSCLVAHLVRVLGLIHLDNYSDRVIFKEIANGDRTYSLKCIKYLSSSLPNFYKRIESISSGRLAPYLWLSLFYYNMAIYLTPGWLTHKTVSQFMREYRELQMVEQDTPSSDSSLGSIAQDTRCPESLIEIEEFRKISYALADQTLEKAIKISFYVLSPYIPALYQISPGVSPTNPVESLDSHFYHDSYHNNLVNNNNNNWSTGRNELKKWLDQLYNCLNQTLNTPTTPDLEAPSSASSFRSTTSSLASSNMFKYSPTSNGIKNYDYNKNNFMSKYTNQSDQSLSSNESDLDQEYSTLPGKLRSRHINNSSTSNINGNNHIMNSNHDQISINDLAKLSKEKSAQFSEYSTVNRIEAVYWRQLLAHLSFDVLNTILFTGSTKIDWEIGTQLLSGVNWLLDWLKIHKLEKHIRPLNILIHIANLLGIHKSKLLRMSWNDMRQSFPHIPPALLRCILEEYEAGSGVEEATDWSIDVKDASVADEDPKDLIEIALKGWKSKEKLRPTMSPQQSLIYRPTDPTTLFKQNSSKQLLLKLDEKLASNISSKILFRWHNLLQRFPLPRVLPRIVNTNGIRQNDLNGNSQINKINTNSKISMANRKRLTIKGIRRQTDSPLMYTQDIMNKIAEFDTLPNKSMNRPYDDLQTFEENRFVQQNSKCLPGRRPHQSDTEPIFHNNHNNDNNFNESNLKEMNSQQRALYYLRGLAASINGIDLIDNSKHIRDSMQSVNDLGLSSYSNQYPNDHNSQTINSNYDNQFINNGQYSMQSNITNHPPRWYRDPRLQLKNGLSQSLCDFQNPSLNQLNSSSNNRLNMDQLHQTVNDWKQFRTTALGHGIDKIRTKVYEPNSMRTNLFNNRNVSSSLSNLHTHHHHLFTAPDITIQEATDASSEIVSELDEPKNNDSDNDSINHLDTITRKDSLNEVVLRSSLGNSITNVSLYKSNTEGFGLVLVDGERTALDQPGVFVKSVKPNSVASEDGNFCLGDRILAINGKDLTGMTYKDAVSLLKQCSNQTTFTVLRCNLSDPKVLLQSKNS